jgi:SAM-dependent methyltransferase
MDVLDVGCGTGAITADIARAVGPDGMVLGMDRDEAHVADAAGQHAGVENLAFQAADILSLDEEFHNRFDIVTAARAIQWISEPQTAIRNMKKAAKAGGRVIVLDYNLDETEWEPAPPLDFRSFYQAFLDWRTANHWDNQMASHLTELFRSEGLVDVAQHESDELVRRGDPDFGDPYASGIWLYVIQTLGPNLVTAGFLEERARLRAEEDYGIYIRDVLQLQRHSMLTVEGRVSR